MIFRYYINGELAYKVPVKAVGVIEKIYIGDSEYFYSSYLFKLILRRTEEKGGNPIKITSFITNIGSIF